VPVKIATWNVNSLRVRLSHVADWASAAQPDVLCLQETKLPDSEFPLDAIRELGYRTIFSGQKTYNGVATLCKATPEEVATELPGADDPQRRVLMANIDGVRVLNVYVPNGQAVDSDKFQYKLAWLERLITFVEGELEAGRRLIVLGDFNIAPEDQDVYDPEAWRGKVLCSDPERSMFQRLIELGLKDVFRKFEQEPNSFSWWDYRAAAFRRNMGLRIDHILAGPTDYQRCTGCAIDKAPRKWERPSDHAPVVATFVAR